MKRFFPLAVVWLCFICITETQSPSSAQDKANETAKPLLKKEDVDAIQKVFTQLKDKAELLEKPQETISLPPEGTELFRNYLAEEGLKPEVFADRIASSPSSYVLVIYGPVRSRQPIQYLSNFIRQGGAVLYATDHSTPELVEPFGLYVTGRVVRSPESRCYQSNSALPFLVPSRGIQGNLAESLGFREKVPLDRIVANNGSTVQKVLNFRINDPALFESELAFRKEIFNSVRPILSYPRGSEWGNTFGVIYDDLRNYDPANDHAAVAGELFGGGKLMVLADHSLLENQAVYQGQDYLALADRGLDNNRFCRNVAKWLASGPAGPRRYCLFIENEKIQSRLELPRIPLPRPPLDVLANAILNTANPIVDSLQNEDTFNQLLARNVGPKNLRRNFVLGILFTLMGLCIAWLWSQRQGTSTWRKGKEQGTTPALAEDMEDASGDYRPRLQALWREAWEDFSWNQTRKRSLPEFIRDIPWYAWQERRKWQKLQPWLTEQGKPLRKKQFTQYHAEMQWLWGRWTKRYASLEPQTQR